jgi:hypothetical protein
LLDNEITQYRAVKDGKKYKPIAKVVYKVFVDRQEVVYWMEIPRKEPSPLYKLRECIVVDKNNWKGTVEYQSIIKTFQEKGLQESFPLAWDTTVEVVNGKFTSGRFTSGDSVSWWTWHFETEPSPTNLLPIIGYAFAILITIFIVKGAASRTAEIARMFGKSRERLKHKNQEKKTS